MSTNFPQPKRREAWRKQEERLHNEGAPKVSGSGNGVRKGDNLGESFLIQCKTTEKKQVSIKADDWDKTTKDAGKEDRMPVMQVQIQNRDRLAVLDWDNFVALCEQAGIEV